MIGGLLLGLRSGTASPRPSRARARRLQPYTLESRTPRRSEVRARANSKRADRSADSSERALQGVALGV